MSSFPDEKEILLADGTPFIVKSIENVEDKFGNQIKLITLKCHTNDSLNETLTIMCMFFAQPITLLRQLLKVRKNVVNRDDKFLMYSFLLSFGLMTIYSSIGLSYNIIQIIDEGPESFNFSDWSFCIFRSIPCFCAFYDLVSMSCYPLRLSFIFSFFASI